MRLVTLYGKSGELVIDLQGKKKKISRWKRLIGDFVFVLLGGGRRM
jgi:hypothetical protein